MQLSQREEQILMYVAHGYTPDEIGDYLGITRETVRKITCNIKLKIKLQKSTELAAFYWCKYFGSSLESQRTQLLASIFTIIVLLSIPLDIDRNRYKNRTRCNVEYRLKGNSKHEII